MMAVNDQRLGGPAGMSPTVPMTAPDFGRPLTGILGLPFDAVSLEQAVTRIRGDAFASRRCFVSTPNLNFAITASADPAFRDSVLRSDLNLVDGMPLVWAARLLRLPVPHRVSGADVFEALQAHVGPPLKVYIFGGPPGVAERARDRINQRAGGLQCVGFDEAGFGSIESMSDSGRIDRINASGAHFIVVALGAKKGQTWIEHNASRLMAPVLSHLGAVVNFAAGEVSRAPRWVQRFGGEWLWRIKEEPALWARYWSDGLRALGLLWTHLLPDALDSIRARPGADAGRVETEAASGSVLLRLHGSWHRHNIEPLRAALARAASERAAVSLDLSGVTAVDDCLVATVLVAYAWFAAHGGFEVSGASEAIVTSFRRKLAGHIFVRAGAPLSAEAI